MRRNKWTSVYNQNIGHLKRLSQYSSLKPKFIDCDDNHEQQATLPNIKLRFTSTYLIGVESNDKWIEKAMLITILSSTLMLLISAVACPASYILWYYALYS